MTSYHDDHAPSLDAIGWIAARIISTRLLEEPELIDETTGRVAFEYPEDDSMQTLGELHLPQQELERLAAIFEATVLTDELAAALDNAGAFGVPLEAA